MPEILRKEMSFDWVMNTKYKKVCLNEYSLCINTKSNCCLFFIRHYIVLKNLILLMCYMITLNFKQMYTTSNYNEILFKIQKILIFNFFDFGFRLRVKNFAIFLLRYFNSNVNNLFLYQNEYEDKLKKKVMLNEYMCTKLV